MKFKFSRGFAVSAALTALWMTVIFLFSAQDGSDSSGLSGRVLAFICGLFNYTPSAAVVDMLSFCVRKAAHMTEFGLLGVLWLNTLRHGFGDFAHRYLTAFVISSIYAMTDEFHQLFIDGRAGRVTDWLIDSAGTAIWLAAAWLLTVATARIKSKKDNKP